MGRKRTTIPINSEKLREAVAGRETWTGIAEQFGVTKQAVSEWLRTGRIPPRALIEICRELNIPQDLLEDILEPVQEREPIKWVCTITLERQG